MTSTYFEGLYVGPSRFHVKKKACDQPTEPVHFLDASQIAIEVICPSGEPAIP